jgi:two-component system cell cycle response regulator DivK
MTALKQEDSIPVLIENLQSVTSPDQRLKVSKVLAKRCAADSKRCWNLLKQAEDPTLALVMDAFMQLGIPGLKLLEHGFRSADDHVREFVIEGLSRKVLSKTKPSPDDFSRYGSLLLKSFDVPLRSRNAIVLHIEDDLLNRTYFQRCLYLSEYDYIVFEADNGAKGLRMADELLPDLVVVDINLTGIGGCEVIRRLRSSNKTMNMIIVAFTAYMSPYGRQKVLAAGCDGYIEKPINIKFLPQQLYSFLQE